jgi:hypothetical protein
MDAAFAAKSRQESIPISANVYPLSHMAAASKR